MDSLPWIGKVPAEQADGMIDAYSCTTIRSIKYFCKFLQFYFLKTKNLPHSETDFLVYETNQSSKN